VIFITDGHMSIRDSQSLEPSRTWMTEDGVVCHDLTGISHLTQMLMQELFSERVRIAEGRKCPVMMIATNVLTVDFEVQLHASDPRLLVVTEGIAIVGDSFMIQHLTSMFLSYHAPGYPVERFDTEEKARVWLMSLREGAQREGVPS
jgi:hypothetical protein